MAAGTSELQVEDVTAGLEKAREHRPCLDGDPVTLIPLPRTTALALQPDLPEGPGLASGPQLPPAACAAAGTAPADASGQWGTATPIPVGLPDADLSPEPSSHIKQMPRYHTESIRWTRSQIRATWTANKISLDPSSVTAATPTHDSQGGPHV